MGTPSYEGKQVYMGLDVHREFFVASCICDGVVVKRCRMPGTAEAVISLVSKELIIGTGLLLLHQPRKTSRNIVSTTINNFRHEGRRSIALVLLLTKLWGVGFAADAALRVSDSYNSDLITSP